MAEHYERSWDQYPTMTVHEDERPGNATGVLDTSGQMICRPVPDFRFGFQPMPRIRVKAGSTRAG